MAIAAARAVEKELITGERMSRERFLRVWEQLPDLKFAELIDGTVFVASPVAAEHGFADSYMQGWLMVYAARTPGCRSGSNMTWLMKESAPQPDCCLTVAPIKLGGKQHNIAVGAPQLVVEITFSTRSHDYGPKRALYQRAGVKEYLTVDGLTETVVWRRLVGGSYRALLPDDKGVVRSVEFPGLWLSTKALWDERGSSELLQVLEEGLRSPEHAAFVRRLERAKLKR